MQRFLTHLISTPRRATLVLVGVAACWILLSDWLILAISDDPQVLSWLQTTKGWLFVAGTGLLLSELASRLRRREQQLVRELNRSEARFRSLVQNSSEMVRLVDASDTITFESPAIRQILGYDPSEVEGKSAMAFVHPDDVAIRERFRADTEQGHGRATYRVRNKRGDWRWVEASGLNLLGDPEVGAVVINSRDVTDSKATEEALREQQALVDALLESSPGVLYLFDESGHYLRWNENLLKVTGYGADEMATLSPLDTVVPEERELTKELIQRVTRGESASAVLTLLTKSGERIPYLFNGTSVTLSGKTYLAGVGLDHSEQHAAREKIQDRNADLEERLERLNTLQEIDRAMSDSLELPLVLSVFLEGARYHLEVDAATVLLHEAESQVLTVAASSGFETSRVRGARLRFGEGPAGRAALSRQLVRLEGEEIEREIADSDDLSKEEFSGYWAVPLMAKGRVQGVLELLCREVCAKDDDWYEFLDTMASQAAIAIDNAMLFQQQSRSNAELRLAYDSTIEGWARALDLRDRETEGHSRRVTELTTALARELDFPSDDLVYLRWGALLHDIGKMGVPDAILLKKGKLATDEWELMKAHPEHAFELLSPISFLRPALDIPYAHHERWDGKGYPLGLKESEIPLPARIFAVVDVFDALTSERPYRPPWPRDKALEYVRAQRGRQFDPHVVDAFLEVIAQESLPAD